MESRTEPLWQNNAGIRMPIREMSDPHLLNTVRWCERRAWHPNDSTFRALVSEVYRRDLGPQSLADWAGAQARATADPDFSRDKLFAWWEIWVGYGPHSANGNPIRLSPEQEQEYRFKWPSNYDEIRLLPADDPRRSLLPENRFRVVIGDPLGQDNWHMLAAFEGETIDDDLEQAMDEHELELDPALDDLRYMMD